MDFEDSVFLTIVIAVVVVGIVFSVFLLTGDCKHFMQESCYCSQCGEQLKKICPVCDTVSSLSTDYCRKCGYSFVNFCADGAK